ncbi:capsule biosynthesis protein [Moraxella bovis]|uniref:Vi polysaccharide export inner membrane protein VexD n=1 Tax=Moraxella bovis TaxID=476 RepID=A0A1S9ZYX5_MORBO|nr:capsule biosynthesis protein [Moraxella bovis]OOR88670.1 capsule biosynthesis protein [Moraxella bovis]UZA08636.1 capsule biosynthesis protein [Moraxella bovis]UZA16462.1 capsule biosynthesis protein [Moraxella bovis]UZA35610.1 capsule biosynthesis protein [Moraxella bovis]STY90845.1 Vi polysaccharide export inner membrane protein VexD [Moraxella bovis]
MFTKLKNKRNRSAIILFILVVILPWIAISAYTLVLAHPRYVSTSDVVIKQVSEQGVSATGISSLLGVNNTNREDALYLTKYILSNDMIDKLDAEFKFREAYHVNGADFINEIPSDATQEELREYFKKRVSVSLDELSYVLTVTTEGFEPEYALKLNQAILRESEKFVNNISKDVANEQLAFVSAQAADAEQKLNDAKKAVIDYQNQNEIFDPQVNAQMVNQVIGTLQGQLSSLRTEERQLLSYLNPEAPQVVSLRSQIRSVEKQIKDEQAKLTSPRDAKLNAKTVEFETLKAEAEFASELYKIALTSLESSRAEVMRKMKNLVVITSPHRAEDALYPRMGYVLGTSLVLLLILYGFIVLVLAVIKDHAK